MNAAIREGGHICLAEGEWRCYVLFSTPSSTSLLLGIRGFEKRREFPNKRYKPSTRAKYCFSEQPQTRSGRATLGAITGSESLKLFI